ncbi:WapI family immunity protein [Leifsonia xyli]|uniref:WapI family immunity protein n=1 Tax=Leifsonia xyli TaxID=1575 RepID=UPI003D66F3C6
MRLKDDSGERSVELRPSARDGDRVVVDAVVDDGGRRWALSEACLTSAEAHDLAAWLAGLAADATAAADEWTSLIFESTVLSMSGHRIPGGTVELRIALLRMRAEGGGTTDVVVGLRTPESAVSSAARDLVAELDALAG